MKLILKNHLFPIKKKYIKIIVSVLIAIVVLGIISLITSASRTQAEKKVSVDILKETGVINIGLRGDIRPLCTFDNQRGMYEGLEKDIADEIVSRIFIDGILVNFVLVNSETKDAFLESGDLDMSFGASIAGNAKGINYSASYYSDGSAFLVMEGSMTSQMGLNGGTIAVVQGSFVSGQNNKNKDLTNIEAYLNAHNIAASVKTFGSYPEAVEALRIGHVDGICANEIFLKLFGKSGMLILPERFLLNNYCIQVSSSLGAYNKVVDDTIAAMKEDGTLSKLIKKWNLINYAGLEE
ncbi:MAG: transporter substrate-binding domain-containing protein [Christensenellales bacterium]